MTNYIGKAVKRVEDKRFITGKGRYTDDIVLPAMAHAYIVRSPYAHARIISVDTSAAEAMEGVIKVFTGKDIAASGINGIPTGWQVNFKNGETMKEPPHPLLVADKARYMGDAVAVVIAETKEIARDAGDIVEVEYEELPAVADAKKATEPGAPLVHDDAPNNLCFDWELGNPKAEVNEAMSKAHHITTLEFTNQRVIPNAIEPRSAIGHYEEANDKYTLYTTSQNTHLTRLLMCAFVLGIPSIRCAS